MNDKNIALREKKIERERALALDRRQLLTLPPEKALDLLAEHAYPVTLVQSMADEDFYYLVHGIGPEDARPVMGLASNQQWEYLLDMETWDRDRMTPHGMTKWLERLLKADADRFTHWITHEKRDDFVLYLFKNLELHIREYDEDPSEVGKDFFSEDQTHYIRLLPYPAEQKQAQERRDQFLTDLLKRISIYDFVVYRDLLLGASAIIPAESEEECLRLRKVRLAEKGFLPFDEAIGVYQPLKVDQLLDRREKAQSTDGRIGDPHPRLVNMHTPDKDANRFARVLSRFQDASILQPLQVEFAGLCNQVIAADQQQIREKAALTQIVQKVGDFISIGLEKVAAASDPETQYGDAVLLQKYLLADIFRVGYGCALALKWKAEKWHRRSWFAEAGLPVSFWGENWLGVLGGLLIKRPLFFANYDQGVLYREFSILADIEKTENILDQIIAFDNLLSLINISPGQAPPNGILTYQNLILTAWANHYLAMDTSDQRPVALGPAQLRQLLSDMWAEDQPPRRISQGMREIFLGWLADRSGLADFEIAERMAPALEAMFDEIEEELGRVEPDKIDPRYIHSIVLQPS